MALFGSLCALVGLMTALTAYIYASPVPVPDCSYLQHPLKMHRREVVAVTLLTQPPFQHSLTEVSYQCELEQKAYIYLDGDVHNNGTCPSGFVCLFYQGESHSREIVEGEEFIEFFIKVMGTWKYEIAKMKPAEQFGCNYKKLPEEKRIACVIKPVWSQ